MLAVLREYLAPLKLASGRGPEDLVFGSKPGLPFNPQSVVTRADAAWTAAGLNRLELHEGRHTFASLLIRVGIGAKEVTAYMGHASIQTTFDLYGKLFEGSELEDASRVDAFLQDASSARSNEARLV